MAATDAKPIPIKNQVYRVYFPILDGDGDLVASATGLASVISTQDGTSAAGATPVQGNGNFGFYYLDLTQAQMNGDAVCIAINTTTSGAKATPIVLYPQEAGDIKVDVQSVDTAGTVGVIRGTITGGTTTNPTATIVPATFAVVGNQFKGRIITFDAATTTAALRGQATDITANASASAGAAITFTVTALTTTPASGDLFSIT